MTKRPRPLRVPVDEVPRRSAIGLPPATVEAAPERSEPEVPRASRPPATTRAEPDLMTPSAAPNAPASNPPASNPASNPPPAPLSAAPLSLGQPLSAQRTTVDMRPPTRAEPSAEVDDTAVPDISSQSGEEEPAATLSAATSESATLSTASGSATLDTADDAPPEAPTPEPTLPLGEAAPALAAGDVGAFEDEQTLPANASLSGGTRPSAPSMPSAASAPPVSAPPVSAPPPVSLKPSVPATASAPDEAAAAAASPAEAPLAPTPEPSEPPPSALPSEPTEPALRLAAVDPDQVETAERTQPESAKSPVVEETPAVRQTSAVIIRGMVSVSSSVGMVDDATAFEDEATPSDSHPAMMSDESDEDLLLEERATQPLSDPPASIEEPTNEGADQPLELAVSDSDAAESFEAESLADSDIEALAPTSTKVEEPALEPALEAALEAVPEAGPSSGEMSLDDELLELDEEEQEDRLSSRPPPPPAGEAKAPEEAPKARRRQWFETFFSDDYLRTVQPPSDKNVAREVDFIERSLGLAAGASILDVGCGLGLHALELSKRGYVVVGLDLSESMLARARSEAKDLGLGATFIQGDMREMTFDFAFDAVLCWGTSFGYFDDEMNRQTIARLYQALKPKGTLLLDIVNRDHVIQQQPNLVWFEGDGCVCMEESKFNYFQSRLQVKRTVILDDGRQRENSYSMRLYSPHEVGKLLHVQGFRVAEFSGRLATPGVFFGATSPQMMILAERRMEATKPAMKEPPAPPPPAPNGAAPAAPAVPGAAPVAPAIPGAPSVPAVPAVPPASSAAAPAVPSRPPPPPAPDEGE
ncbi:MAG: class I SAM-dependent methyltransferase [Polyangiales bacterium]